MSHYRDEEDALGADIPDEREELLDEVGCHYPGRCVVAGPHLRGECTPYPPAQAGTSAIRGASPTNERATR